jgi:hypothetical protein
MRLPAVVLLSLAAGCGGTSTPPKNGGSAEQPDSGGGAENVPTKPERPAPPELGDDEKKDLGALCNLVEPDMYDAEKASLAALDAELAAGKSDDAAETIALETGVAQLAQKTGKLGKPDAERCAAIFEKRTRRRLYDHDPTEEAARDTVEACVKRAVATFGKQSLSYDEGAGPGAAPQGPFCPDDFPVPPSLNDLPYTSKGEDWESPTWKCLQFGLRTEQKFQLEYSAPAGKREFHCIARFLPRQGGAPVELRRGGTVDGEGVLQVAENIVKSRMK